MTIRKIIIAAAVAAGFTTSAQACDLCLPVQNGDINRVTELINEGADLNAKDSAGNFALYYAAARVRLSIISLLIDSGADLELKNNDGDTALHRVAWLGRSIFQSGERRIQSMNLLIERGANLNAVNNNGDTPLHEAVTQENLDEINALIAAGANVDVKNNNQNTPLRLAFFVNENFDISNILIAAGANVDIKSSRGVSLLYEQVRLRNMEFFNTLIAAGANVNLQNDLNMQTPLHVAVQSAYFTDALIAARADVNLKDFRGETPLHLATLTQSIPAINALIAAGADINAKSINGNTPLHVIAELDSILPPNPEVSQILIKAGANANAKNNNGDTPLHLAVSQRYSEIVAELVPETDLSIMNNDGKTVLDIAMESPVPNEEIIANLQPPNCDTATTELNPATNRCDCLDETHRFVDGSTTMCEPIPQDDTEETEMGGTQNPPSQTTPQNRSDNKKRRAESINTATGLLVVGLMAVFLAGGAPAFNVSPDFGYSITESGYFVNVGGRADFRKDNWHLYYSANQINRDGEFGDFRYTSGGEYNGDLFAATFSESVAGETAKYNFSLSADWTANSHINIKPVYRLHSFYDKGESKTRNTLNLEGEFRYNGWTIRPAAGFEWRRIEDFGDNARFQINAVHRF